MNQGKLSFLLRRIHILLLIVSRYLFVTTQNVDFVIQLIECAESCFYICCLDANLQYVLRELPSSPVPASCCNALLEAFRKSGMILLT